MFLKATMFQREKKNRVRTRQTKMKTQQTNGKLQISMYACIAAAATAIAVAAAVAATTTVLCAYASLKKILIFVFAPSFSVSRCVFVCIHDRALEIYSGGEKAMQKHYFHVVVYAQYMVLD